VPSEDPVNEQANLWMEHLEKVEQAKPQAARVQVLAAALKLDPEELASRIPADTLRRLKYPLVEMPQPDGTTAFRHDEGIVEGLRPLTATDRGA